MRYLKIHRHHVRSVAYSPDGSQLATASNDYTGKVVDVEMGVPTSSWQFDGVVQCSAFSADGKLVAFGGQFPQVQVIDLESKVSLGIDGASMSRNYCFPQGLAFSPAGRHLVCGYGDRQRVVDWALLQVWTLPGPALFRREQVPGGIWDLAFNRVGDRIVLGTGYGWRIYQVSPWQMIRAVAQGKGCKAIAISPDGQILATAAGWTVLVWELESGRELVELRGHSAPITSLAFTPDSTRLLSGSWDQSVRVWDPIGGQQLAAFDWQRGKVQDIAVAPDGMTAAAGCDKGVAIWDLDE